jgi:hypothetical protein
MERMKNTLRRSAPTVTVCRAKRSDLFMATRASRQIWAEYSVFPDPIGPMTRMRLDGLVKSK